jgi:AraC-like DNA-binding protein
VPPLDDYHLIIFCLSGSAVLRTDQGSFTVDRFNGVACAANRPLAGEFSTDAEQFVVRIDRQRLAAFTGRPDTSLAAKVDLRAAKLQPWLTALRALVSDPETIGLLRRNPDVAADYEQLLLRLLLNGQDAEPRREQARPASVHRAVAYLRAHASGNIALADIAQAAGVAERTLNDAFQRFQGVSPMRYLRDLRLDRVRAGLRAGQGSVTELALANGFTHLSRFAQDYADRFGERPSETLRRR